MPDLGRTCLLLGLLIAVLGIGASLYGARSGRDEWVAAGRRCVFALAGVLTVSFAVLEAAFLRSDFSFAVVATHSSTTTPTLYKATALWASQEGSLLLWVWLLSLWSSLALMSTRGRLRGVVPYATAVLLAFAGFFLVLDAFLADPFRLVSPVPLEGAGLQPLLRHPAMVIHPPMLYSGYTLFSVPFAFAVGALVSGRLDADWLHAVRRFALMGWFFLGFGILLGARWSWSELGWGGYWAWDPVENAALMPWLTGTAFLHSAMIQQKRGMLKVWNVSLVLATGLLAVLGTFLVRSGILSSIHAFGGSTLGKPFLGFIAALLIGSVAIVALRRADLRPDDRLDSLFSREAVFVLNNLLLVGLCFVIFWGTFFPLISEAVTGTKASVGPPWFTRYTVPLAIMLVLLSGIGPLIAWRRATVANARRVFVMPTAAAALAAVALGAVGAASRPQALAMFCVCAFAVVAVGQELWRGANARRAVTGGSLPTALGGLVARNRRRYGGYVVHVGIGVLFVGVAASSAFQHVRDVRLKPGESADVGGYEVRYVRATSDVQAEKLSFGAVLEVSRDGRRVATLAPSRGYYPTPGAGSGPLGRFFAGEATSEVGLRSNLRRDIWTAVEPDLDSFQSMIDGVDQRFPRANGEMQALFMNAIAERYRLQPPPASFRFIASPLVTWIWLGGLIVAAGVLLSLSPVGVVARVRVRRSAPAAIERGLRSA